MHMASGAFEALCIRCDYILHKGEGGGVKDAG